jgi:peptidoglycan/LPS O-acetylase OafA/YrhL
MASEDDRRHQAIRRIKAKRDFTREAVTFALVGLVLVLIWFFTTRDTEDPFFWPILPILAMGIALAAQGRNVLRTRPMTEAEVRRELDDDG